MSTGVAFHFETVGELLKRLGNVPPHRIRMQPAPGTATECDVIALHDRHNRLFELVDGTLVEKTMGLRESMLAAWIVYLLQANLQNSKLGLIAGADGMVRLLGKQVRIPDVSFISWDKLPGRKLPREPIPDLVPDLAVEVLSESNTKAEMERKLKEYFLAGVRLVWLVDPNKQTVEVFTAPDESRVLAEADLLTANGVLPGLMVTVRSIFEDVPGEEEGPPPARPAKSRSRKRGRKK
ncbi:MAG TPA: Uma2 family endonuclease [Gemmataceae bacterium]|nr:Uma2 family endonuclease [Gemmataceae bacterium]